MSETILVTGGAGYIGSHTCRRLAEAGYQPVAFDNLHQGRREFVRWGPLIEGDIADADALAAAFAAYRPAGVVHFAALANVGDSVAAPFAYYGTNVAGTLVLLEAMRRAGVGCIVFSSTCAIYGPPTVLPIPEQHPAAPVSPYGASKLFVERIMADAEAAYGLRSVALRYFNAAGADPAAEIGEWHDPETHLIPLVLDAALGRRPAITVFGDDYPTPDGTCIRDYVHVLDLADAHVTALRWLLAGGSSLRLNLGSGSGYSVHEVIAAARRVTGLPIDARVAARRPGDPPILVGDTQLAGRTLGWRPERPALEVQIEDAWRWHRKTFGQ